jgi:1-aminocyclopropane-1-carboxylate deaminase/D-cysteine desulfhydrase-like pyridoxal-dependent ACC family enzyme
MHPKLINLEKQFSQSILTQVKDPWLQQFNIEIWMKRDDLLHPVISGNKWRKLKYILDHALSLHSDTIISMGGAYSNHLHALAYIGQLLDLQTVGMIRGERPEWLNPTLTDLLKWGMELRFVSRTQYRELRAYKSWHEFPGLKPKEYWLPEGGAVQLALNGVKQLVEEIELDYDLICVPCGTGTTLAGIIEAMPQQVTALGFAALKGSGFLAQDVSNLLPDSRTPPGQWRINTDYHFGGFGKTSFELLSFIETFTKTTGITLEPIYTGKMMYGVYDLIRLGYIIAGQRVVVVHTGGLQGDRKCKEY